ncbi:MAG: glutathione binding-like protein [Allopontixanthobacter sediminis]
MSYPVLRVARDYARVEVRKGRGAARWRDMEQVFSGPADAGTEWKGGEGEKLAARHCLWPSDPDSTLSQPYQVSGVSGLGTGEPETLTFPSGLARLFSLPKANRDENAASEIVPMLHEDPRSGNCYKIKLTAALLGLPLETRQYDILRGETRTPEFLGSVNSHGRIPVLQVGDWFLPESNAACWYLAAGSLLVPEDRFEQAETLRWMFFEQYSHEPNIATLRFWLQFVGEGNLSPQQASQILPKRIAGTDALARMDEHLDGREWFVGNRLTLADIVLYAYTHVAEAGSFPLRDYRHVCAWLDRVAGVPKFVTMG